MAIELYYEVSAVKSVNADEFSEQKAIKRVIRFPCI